MNYKLICTVLVVVLVLFVRDTHAKAPFCTVDGLCNDEKFISENCPTHLNATCCSGCEPVLDGRALQCFVGVRVSDENGETACVQVDMLPSNDNVRQPRASGKDLGVKSSNDIQCKNENGVNVDYFIIMKLPNGGQYYYMDADNTELVKSQFDLSKNEGAVYRTLAGIYGAGGTSSAMIMFNDEPANGHTVGITYAHSKGVVQADAQSGYWLVHSVPNFPDDRATGYNGFDSYKFGQSFLCMSLSPTNIERAAEQLLTMHVKVYDSNMPTALSSLFPKLNSVIMTDPSPQESSVMTITTLGRRSFKSIAKSRSWADNLYSKLVAQELKSDLLVNTWQNGAHTNKMPPFCDTPYQISNVVTMQLESDDWRSTQDHSKWAVTSNGDSLVGVSSKVTCIGGVNRQYSQSKRGGGVVCYKHSKVWSEVSSSIKTTDGCSS